MSNAVLTEIDRLVARGVDYIYFIDEIFGVGKNVLQAAGGSGRAQREDRLPDPDRSLDGRDARPAGARRIPSRWRCGIESITDAGRDELNKNCRISTERISELLIYARHANPVGAGQPDPHRQGRQSEKSAAGRST